MPQDFFLEIITKKGGKIKGETMSADCPEQIDVDKFTIGLTASPESDEAEEGSVQLEQAEFECEVSVASPILFATLCTSDAIKTMTLTCRKAGPAGKDSVYLQWQFNDARLVSYKMIGSDELVKDVLKIEYTGVEISYRQQKQDGSLAQPLQRAYDSNENKMTNATFKRK